MSAPEDNADLGAMVERLRDEIEIRKSKMPSAASAKTTAERSREQLTAVASPLTGKSRMERAQWLIERAAVKNEVGRWWPRLLRRMRRNQGAVNDSLTRAVRALLETLESGHRKFAELDFWMTEQKRREAGFRAHLAGLERALAKSNQRIVFQDDAIVDLRKRMDALLAEHEKSLSSSLISANRDHKG